MKVFVSFFFLLQKAMQHLPRCAPRTPDHNDGSNNTRTTTAKLKTHKTPESGEVLHHNEHCRIFRQLHCDERLRGADLLDVLHRKTNGQNE